VTQAARENACSSEDILIIIRISLIRISLFADIIKDVLPGLERNRDIIVFERGLLTKLSILAQ
jgi:hypothetical protein